MIRTRTSPKFRVRQDAVPVSPLCSLRSIVDLVLRLLEEVIEIAWSRPLSIQRAVEGVLAARPPIRDRSSRGVPALAVLHGLAELVERRLGRVPEHLLRQDIDQKPGVAARAVDFNFLHVGAGRSILGMPSRRASLRLRRRWNGRAHFITD